MKKRLIIEDLTTTSSVGNLSGSDIAIKRNYVFLSRYKKNNDEFILWQTGEDSYKLTTAVLDDNGDLKTVKEWNTVKINDVLNDMKKDGYRVIKGDEFMEDDEFDEDVANEELSGVDIFSENLKFFTEDVSMNYFMGNFKKDGITYTLWQKGYEWYELTTATQDKNGNFIKVKEWTKTVYDDIVKELKKKGYIVLDINGNETNENKNTFNSILDNLYEKYGYNYVKDNIDKFIPLIASKLKINKDDVVKYIISESKSKKFVVAYYLRNDGYWDNAIHETAESASKDYIEKSKYYKTKILDESGEVLIFNF